MQRYLRSGHRFAIALGLALIVGVVVWVFR
jgi:hypothetical protein